MSKSTIEEMAEAVGREAFLNKKEAQKYEREKRELWKDMKGIHLERAAALRAAADTLRSTSMRQIEDAPKDGTEIDIWIEGYKGEPVRIPDCRWVQAHGESGWYRHDRDFYQEHGDSWQEIEDRIIGWMPIPVFPTGEKGTAHVA